MQVSVCILIGVMVPQLCLKSFISGVSDRLSSAGAAYLGARHSSPCSSDHHLEPLFGGPGDRLLAPILPEGSFPREKRQHEQL